MSTAVLRARRALHDAGLGDVGPVQRVSSAVNEVWAAGPYVVRVSATPGSRRLEWEATIAPTLPPEVRYPGVVTYGRNEFGEWLVLPRIGGDVLSRAWGGMSERERRAAVHDLAGVLRRLHHAPAPTAADGQPLTPPFLEGDTLECPHQLPPARLLQLVERARALPNVERHVLDQVAELVLQAAPALDDEGTVPTLVHGDAHFENVLWDGERVTALLDLEWGRAGPADLDLDIIIRFCAEPDVHVAPDYGHLADSRDYREVPAWLRQAYPELFAHPRLRERLALYSLSYDVRHLLLYPPKRPADELPPLHPYNRIRRLVDGRSPLGWMEW